MSGLPVPQLTPAFEVVAELGPLEDHGLTRVGHRRVVPITGGEVRGELTGRILPGGADWQVLRADGAVDVDARYTVRTDAGAFVLVHSRGLRSGSPEVLETLLRGDPVDASAYYFRTVLTLETSAPELAPLEHAVFVASAARDADRVRYVAYRVS
ncbi:DUF3237 domain-containing protein [Protaetiibacter mangrovi]|uniref:UPF0311 protein NUH29_09785 n=1 Tax=Protaetiibacter mangrovi TaxID=2970926 RepID=A0ABT1ZGL3_9MICO|nr:DUF3237 domain-containing protein [Protaetiibacter mangrovi]MCS0499838.1 DUF3237 domain-containing protein [Protaetiibacter mangrovi]TPX02962.1 DUF3237 domain-containing protein [Schumannella luteola]